MNYLIEAMVAAMSLERIAEWGSRLEKSFFCKMGVSAKCGEKLEVTAINSEKSLQKFATFSA